ncbi:zeta toxin family protein [Notoacmeibacter sp. MSK16QG-6]|uniref:zeta toxin family protein n=1 Tax=Notoacmeibacter sp. MSK16QG-6 TaxID=2957982 RepID=UPI00209CFE2E|nr:zeta toxin family protein [Notoacmeibacter sp. MSK16QG-6]MCP1199874.1 hypothetical protein [Notoacmeibacter sp. MSK16QG-6]
MVLIVGPNGAGKSTLYRYRVGPKFAGPFVNADIIQRDELRDTSPEAAYRAAGIAAKRRAELIAMQCSFATETVFSHIAKLDLIEQARAAGYTILLMHVGLERADLAVGRVRSRVDEGGHAVPEEKIRQRYDRNSPLIRIAMLACDAGHVFDNSALNTPPQRIISFRAGRISFVSPHLPRWALQLYRDDLRL